MIYLGLSLALLLFPHKLSSLFLNCHHDGEEQQAFEQRMMGNFFVLEFFVGIDEA
jgi:hypothetical protein